MRATYRAYTGPFLHVYEGLSRQVLGEHVSVDRGQLGQPQAAAVLGQQLLQSALNLGEVVHTSQGGALSGGRDGGGRGGGLGGGGRWGWGRCGWGRQGEKDHLFTGI